MTTLVDIVKNNELGVANMIFRRWYPQKLPPQLLLYFEETCNFSDLRALRSLSSGSNIIHKIEFDDEGTFYKEHEAQIWDSSGDFILEGQPNKNKLNIKFGVIPPYQITQPFIHPYKRLDIIDVPEWQRPVFAIDRVYARLEMGGHCPQTFTLNGRAGVDGLNLLYAQFKLPEDSSLREKGFENMLHLLIPKGVYIPSGR